MPTRHTLTPENLVDRLEALALKTGRDDIPEHLFTEATGIKSYRIMKIMGSYGALRQAAEVR